MISFKDKTNDLKTNTSHQIKSQHISQAVNPQLMIELVTSDEQVDIFEASETRELN